MGKGEQLAGSTTKKVLIRRFDREPMAGYVHPQTYLRPNGVELSDARTGGFPSSPTTR